MAWVLDTRVTFKRVYRVFFWAVKISEYSPENGCEQAFNLPFCPRASWFCPAKNLSWAPFSPTGWDWWSWRWGLWYCGIAAGAFIWDWWVQCVLNLIHIQWDLTTCLLERGWRQPIGEEKLFLDGHTWLQGLSACPACPRAWVTFLLMEITHTYTPHICMHMCIHGCRYMCMCTCA